MSVMMHPNTIVTSKPFEPRGMPRRSPRPSNVWMRTKKLSNFAVRFRREDVLESVDDATRQVLLRIQQGGDEILIQQQESERLVLKRHERLVGII
jgi:hypothetical protein